MARFRLAGLALLVLLSLSAPAAAQVSVSFGWERPVQFKVVDAETGEAVARPLLVVATSKEYPGAPAPVKSYDVYRGNAVGVVDYKASEKVPGVELRVVASGYSFLTKQVHWKDLPQRKRDSDGLDLGPPPVVTIELKNLERSGEWARNFKLNIGPALEEFLEIGPPAMSRDGKKLIGDFLDKERGKLLGF
ncbi:hypothetical protein DESUT3_01710 [Desulfuromonas versatilis]|uniref:Carboxypeptidase regulatory-like domain-containing protein n=1 Tax=Desulfuromonas versatilis TaxID=2802975 RepID=A0ABM8HRN6_9BACT|nr:hypothetical protein [Desulfuromonas versatilis]BCR03102.1 hypothetical protein DESUT3_01710 [Desulfuromonas versatilis]